MAENDNFDFLRDGKALNRMRELRGMILTTRDNAKAIGTAFEKVTKNINDIESGKLKKNLTEASKGSKALTRDAQELGKLFNTINRQTSKFADLQSKVFTSNKAVAEISKERGKLETRLYEITSAQRKATDDFRLAQEKVRNLTREIAETQDGLLIAEGDERKILGEKLNSKRKQLDIEDGILEQTQRYAEELVESKDSVSQIVDEYKNLETYAESINDKVGFFNGMAAFVKDIPGLGAISKPFQDAAEAARKAQIHSEKVADINFKTGAGLNKEKIIELGLQDELLGKNGKLLTGTSAIQKIRKLGLEDGLKGMTGMQAGTKALGKAMKKALVPVVAIAAFGKALAAVFKLIVESAMESQKRTTLIAREFGISRDSAIAMRKEMQAMVASSGKLYVNVGNLLAAQTMLVNQLDRGGQFSQGNLETILLLTKRMGVTDDVATKVAARAEAFGVNSRTNIDTIMQMNNELYNSGQSTATIGQLMNSVSEATGQVAASLGFSNTNIAKAVNQVRRFGLNLMQARNISEGLLDFEKSISAELEAELFLGRDINLDKARMMSLQGDIVGATSEVMKITRGLTAEQRKSPVVMGALADIIGISVDELQDAYLLETDRARQGQQQLENYQKYQKLVREQNNLEYRYKKDLKTLNQQILEAEEEGRGKIASKLREERDEVEKNLDLSREKLKAAQAELGIANATAASLESNITAQELFNETVARLKDRLVEFTTSPTFDKVLLRLERFATKGFKGLFGKLDDEDVLRDKDAITSIAQQREREINKSLEEQKEVLKDQEATQHEDAEKTRESIQLLEEELKNIGEKMTQQNFDDFINNKFSTGIGIGESFRAFGGLKDKKFEEIRKQAITQGYEEEFNEYMSSVLKDFKSELLDITNYTERATLNRKINTLTSALGAENIVDDFIIRPGEGIQKFNKDDIVIGGTNLLGGGEYKQPEIDIDIPDNSKAIEKTNTLLEKLIAAVSKGGNVYIDGNKAGRAMVLGTQNLS